jgi:hypothetical protein
MKGNEQKINSLLRFSNQFLFVYLAIFAFSLIGAFTLPEESEKLRKASFVMMYVVGLPLAIGTLAFTLTKLGILTDGKEEKK